MKKVYSFTNSNFYRELQKCEKIEKEKAVCIKLMANSIFSEAENETILVQGIIDLFAIKNDEIILVDYKTDFVEKENDLKIKYKKQLELYKKALEEAFNKKVKKVYIYSTYLEKEIECDL